MDIFSRGKKAANEKEQQKEFYFHSVLRAHGLGHAFQGVLRRGKWRFAEVLGFSPPRATKPTCDAYRDGIPHSFICLHNFRLLSTLFLALRSY
jgi:hypothetical protein